MKDNLKQNLEVVKNEFLIIRERLRILDSQLTDQLNSNYDLLKRIDNSIDLINKWI